MNKSEIEANPCWTEVLTQDGSSLLTEGNTITLYFGGDDVFDEICRGIATAKRFINSEMYMFIADGNGRMVARGLSDKAKDGI